MAIDTAINRNPNKTVFRDVRERVNKGVHSFFGPMDVLMMRATRCEWGGVCKHCTYWLDNASNVDAAIKTNADLNEHLCTLLKDMYFPTAHTLSISPSASFFDIPPISLRSLFAEFQWQNVICESTWTYRERYQAAHEFMHELLPYSKFWHKMGLETFDDGVRAKLGKNYEVGSWKNVIPYTRCWTLLVGTIYHTPDIMDRDIEILLEHADMGEVNIISDEFSTCKLSDKKNIDHVLNKWGDILVNTPKIEFTLNPGNPWQTTVMASKKK